MGGYLDLKTTEFLETIFGDNEGYLFISSFDEDGELTVNKPFLYPENLGNVERYISVREDEDVYFSPMLYSVPRRKKVSVSRVPVLYADTDKFDPSGFLIPPSINVVTSEQNGVKSRASYWILDGQYTPEEVESASRAIAFAHGYKEGGVQVGVDRGGWDLSQLLRLPGTTNNKWRMEKYKGEYTEPHPVYVESVSGAIYSLAEITDAYDADDLPDLPRSELDDLPDNLPETKDVLRRVTSSRQLSELYTTEPRGNQDWSDTLYLFVCSLARAGFTPEEALVVAWNAKSNKYKRDNRPMSDLWDYDIKKAFADPGNRPSAKVDREASTGEPYTRPKSEGLAEKVELALLTEEERGLLTRTFVDDYVEWATARTDAPAAYHVASALSILSLVLGEWGVLDPQFGETRLGLFFVIMGETTETRKTTSRKMLKDILRLTQVEDFDYILTSDTTPESLIDALSERPDQSSLYDRDEAQQLIDDIKGGKGYLKGFFETLNELYDGMARGRLRATKQTKDTRVNFVQYLMGIRSQIQDNLELEDFASGWGPRNIFVRGDSPPRTRESARLKQGNQVHDKVDREKIKIVQKIISARDFWSNHNSMDRTRPFAMYFEDDAWERMVDLEWDLKEYFMEHPRYGVIRACIDRLSINTMKVAALFAMMEHRELVNMQDVLNARYYCAQWVEDLVIVIEGVHESLEKKNLDRVEKYIIEHDGLVTYAALLKWGAREGIKRRDMDEYVQSLAEMEVVEIVTDKNNKRSVELYG